MAAAKSVKMLSAILGLYFVVMGLNKLGPWISTEMHKSLKTQHKELFKGSFFKLVVQQKMQVPAMLPSVYRQLMAFNETFCGFILLLVFLPSILGNVANLLLFLQYADYLFSNFYVGNKLDKSGSVAVFLILLVSRMVLVVLTKEPVVSPKTRGAHRTSDASVGASNRADLEEDEQTGGEGDVSHDEKSKKNK